MLDIKLMRSNIELCEQAMKNRNKAIDFAPFKEIDAKRREIIGETEQLKAKQNEISKSVPKLKQQGVNTDELFAEMKQLSAKIKELDDVVREYDAQLDDFMLNIPNIPHESVPIGTDEEANVEIRKHGEPRIFDFDPLPHWELGTNNNMLNPSIAAKVTGSRFTFTFDKLATLERAIISFFLDTHTRENGYTEVQAPYLVHRNSMIGTGQLPKFEEDAFKVANTEYFLIPTAEVPVTNIHRDDVLTPDMLPIKYTAYTACFRAEAGTAGRDTRGLIRQHQFNKVELVKFALPENSYDELESLTKDAERVLQLLKLPYRVSALCTGDIGFSSAKTYDIEVWLPSYNKYVEISSCSNFGDFQARRANIKFRRDAKSKLEYVHTLNGSGVAVGRTVAAIMENYQQADGSIKVPDALIPYCGFAVI